MDEVCLTRGLLGLFVCCFCFENIVLTDLLILLTLEAASFVFLSSWF